MAKTNIAPDSAEDLRKVLGDDATATFEDDPTFVESNPTGNASTENVTVQRDTDDVEDSDDELADEGEDDELDDEEDLEDDEDDEDLEDEDEDDEDEDDAEEVTASSAMRADGLLGYEDKARATTELKLDDSEEMTTKGISRRVWTRMRWMRTMIWIRTA